MRRMLFSAVIAVLLGACLVLAQPGNPPRPTPAGASLSGLPPTGAPYAPLGSDSVSATLGVSGYGANPPLPLPAAFAPPPPGPPVVVRADYAMPQPVPAPLPAFVPPPNPAEVMGLNPAVAVPEIPMAPPVPEMRMPQRGYPAPAIRVQNAPAAMPALPRGTSPAYANLQPQPSA